MKRRPLGKTDLVVSEIGVGTWQLAGPVTIDGRPDGFPEIGQAEAVRLIRACGELGINLIDTAEIYGDGEGERRVGLAVSGCRSDWVIVSKFGMRRASDGRRVCETDGRAIEASLDRSLQRLKTDYIDAYLYHSPPSEERLAGGIASLDRARKAGKVRYWGISTNDVGVAEALWKAGGLDVVLYSHSLLTPAKPMRDLVRRAGLGGLVRGVFEGGRLGGRYLREPPAFQADDIRRERMTSAQFSACRVFENVVPAGMSLSQLALRYVLDDAATGSILLGARSVSQYTEAVFAAGLPPVSESTRARIASLAQQVNGRAARRVWAPLQALTRCWRAVRSSVSLQN